jgi:hypothetical protein
MSLLLGWLWAVISWVIKAVVALAVVAATALFWTEALSRSWKLAKWGVDLQVQRLPESERDLYFKLWSQPIARCKESGYPIEALFQAFVRIPHDCRAFSEGALRKNGKAQVSGARGRGLAGWCFEFLRDY